MPAMRATRGSVKEWPLCDGPRPPGVGGSGARRVVGEKSRLARAADGACASGWLCTCACVVRMYVRACVRACVEDDGRAAGDNDGDKARPGGRTESARKRRGASEEERGENERRTEKRENGRASATEEERGRRTGVTLYEAGDISQDRKSVVGILGV